MREARLRPRRLARRRSSLAFAAVYVLWGSTYLAIRIGVETIPPFLMAGVRHPIAGVLLLRLAAPLAARPRRPRPDTGVRPRSIGGLMLLGGNGLVTWAEQRVPSGLAALIVASVPIWMTLLHGAPDPARGRTASCSWGSRSASAGLAFLVAPGRFAGAGHVDPLGAAALLTAALIWAIGSLYSRRAALPSSTLLATAMEMMAGGAILLTVSAALAGVGRASRSRRSRRGRPGARLPDRGRLAAGLLARTSSCSARRRPRACRPTPTSIRSSPCSSAGRSGEAVTLRTALRRCSSRRRRHHRSHGGWRVRSFARRAPARSRAGSRRTLAPLSRREGGRR